MEYLALVDVIYGIYLDSTAGYAEFSKSLTAAQLQISKSIGVDDMKLFEDKPFYFSNGDPNNNKTCVLHAATQREVIERNKENGLNYKTIANLCIVLIYQYWEDHFRKLIAEESGMNKDDLKVDIFRDLNSIRQSIIHHKGIAVDKIKKAKILRFFNAGDEIIFSKKEFDMVIAHIKFALNALRV